MVESQAPASTKPPLPFRPPKQGRSQETLNRIAEAGLTLMEEKGVDGATVSEIVARAGASVGSFYARFPGKEDLVRFLRARVWTEARAQWDAALEARAWDDLPVEKVVEGVVGLLLRSYRADFQRRRVLGREGGADPEGMNQLLDFHDHVLETVIPLLGPRGEGSPPKAGAGSGATAEAVGIGYRVMVGAIREFLELEAARTLSNRQVPGLPDSTEMGPELARIWAGYLTSEAEAPPQEAQAVDFFDPWG